MNENQIKHFMANGLAAQKDVDKALNAGELVKLLPCPFCGGPAKAHRQYDGRRRVVGHFVNCNHKGCPVFATTRVRRVKSTAVAEWNTRQSA